MSFARKFKRKHGITTSKANRVRCCGQKMRRKEDYDTDDKAFVFCEICGKEKFVDKNGVKQP